VSAFHQAKNAIGPALDRQMDVAGKCRDLAIGLDQAVAKLERMRRRETKTIDAWHAGQVMQKQRKIGLASVVQRATVGVDVLTE